MDLSNLEIALILSLNAAICILLPRILTLNWAKMLGNSSGNVR